MNVTGQKSLSDNPCIGICENDKEICGGCGRSTIERRDWASYSEEQRIEINKRIVLWGDRRVRTQLEKEIRAKIDRMSPRDRNYMLFGVWKNDET